MSHLVTTATALGTLLVIARMARSRATSVASRATSAVTATARGMIAEVATADLEATIARYALVTRPTNRKHFVYEETVAAFR